MLRYSWNFKIITVVRYILKSFIELKARLINKRFYCNALNGTSDYNISINSDMTVSCSCQDHDGTGYIGDLSSQNFLEIFNGSIAKKMRNDLANGRLPLALCTRCSDLRLVEKSKASYYKENYSLPRDGIMIENTVNCNLKCLACPRSVILSMRKKTNLNLGDIKKISLLIKEHQIKFINFFKLGDPFLSPTIYEELKIIRDENPTVQIETSTNGQVLDTDTKREAALMFDCILFSIDGNNTRVLRKYHRTGSFEKAYNNMKALVLYRDSKGVKKPVIEWRYIIFNWNDKRHMILEAIDLAKKAGVNSISFWPTKNPIYGISWRYQLGSFFANLGERTWRGKEAWEGRKINIR